MNKKFTFDDKFEALGEYYNIESPIEIRQQIRKNENIFILLDEIKPYLEKSFSDAKYSLEMNFEPETDDRFIILFINVSKERFNNGIVEDIMRLRLEIHDLRHELNVFRELSIMPEISDV